MSKIEWTDETWNPVTGCTPISEGCEHCYAERIAKQRLAGRFGYPEAPNHFDVTLHYDRLHAPEKWRKPRMVFVCSMGDLFHDLVPDNLIAYIFRQMVRHHRHIFQLLTKRPERMEAFLSQCEFQGDNRVRHRTTGVIVGEADNWPPCNLWLGVTAENQASACQRIPVLLRTPAVVRFVSVEPMLEAVDLLQWIGDMVCLQCRHQWVNDMDPYRCPECGNDDAFAMVTVAEPYQEFDRFPPLDWVICGAETGPGARPMDLQWARNLRDQCQAAGVPFFMKKVSGRKLPPNDLMVREYPPHLRRV